MYDRFSVIILCYRHFQYLLPAIDSVLEQDYPDIELIISDDCSDVFPAEQILTYIENYRRTNLANVIVRQQKQNGGTVKHLNDVIPECTGKYVTILAGDDAFDNYSVLSSYAKAFESAAQDCYVEMAHTAMYDRNLEQLQEYYLKLPVQKAIEKTASDSTDLLELLIKEGACLPTNSTCFKKEFFEKFGAFDEHYVLVEDYPMHMRLAKEGWKIHYANFIAVRHRDGGISHGQIDAASRSAKLYYTDTINMLRNIVLPEVDQLEKTEQKTQRIRIKKQILWFESVLARANKDFMRMFSIIIKNPGIFFVLLITKVGGWTCKWYAKMLGLIILTWFFIPTVSHMLDSIFNLAPDYFLMPLYYLSALLIILWLMALISMGIYKIINNIIRLPDETFEIG